MNETEKDFWKEVSQGLRKASQRSRIYASYWHYHVQWAEDYGVVKSLIEEMHEDGDRRYKNPLPVNESERWPDCVVEDEHGKSVAVEVTEFVDERVIKLNQRAKTIYERCYRRWTAEAIVAKIEGILRRKDSKANHGGKYASVILVIHCDEFKLTSDHLFPVLDKSVFPLMKNIQRVFLICSYEPKIGGGRCPYRELKIEHSKNNDSLLPQRPFFSALRRLK